MSSADDDFDGSDVRFAAGAANTELYVLEVDRAAELLGELEQRAVKLQLDANNVAELVGELERRAVKLQLDTDTALALIRQTKLSAHRARKQEPSP